MQVVYEPLGTARVDARSAGFAVGARPGDADYDELASAIAESIPTGPQPVRALPVLVNRRWTPGD